MATKTLTIPELAEEIRKILVALIARYSPDKIPSELGAAFDFQFEPTMKYIKKQLKPTIQATDEEILDAIMHLLVFGCLKKREKEQVKKQVEKVKKETTKN